MRFKAKNLSCVGREFLTLNANSMNNKSELDLFLYTRNLQYEHLTLFHVTPVANLFYVIFKDRELKFCDNVHF